MSTLRTFDSNRGTERLGEMWTLSKGGRKVACTLLTHPLGWELVVRIDGDLWRSQVCKTESEVFDVAEQWKPDWQAKGWEV
jgi:hypothetical protein